MQTKKELATYHRDWYYNKGGREVSKAWRQARKDNRECAKCGQKLTKSDGVRCTKCRDKNRESCALNLQKSRDNGWCLSRGCQKPTANFSNCWCNYHWFYKAALSARTRAKNKDIPTLEAQSLTQLLIKLWKAQEGECKLCRVFLRRGEKNDPQGAQVDQILPGIGYTNKNIAWLCKTCNTRKQGFSILDPICQGIIKLQQEVITTVNV